MKVCYCYSLLEFYSDQFLSRLSALFDSCFMHSQTPIALLQKMFSMIYVYSKIFFRESI